MQSDVVKRFLKYVTIHTTSKEDVEKIPSTERQFDLANILVDELHQIGITDATVNKNCYVIGTLPSNLSIEITEKRVPDLTRIPRSKCETSNHPKLFWWRYKLPC